jgi:putative ABC transport system permease protein
LGFLIQTAILVGLLYCLFTIGAGLSFRVLNYPDLTLEGSATVGGAVTISLAAHGASPGITLLAGAVAGAIAGLFTAIQALYLGVSRLLSGIITTAILYSVTIRILGGRANARLADTGSLFDLLNPNRRDLIDIMIEIVCVLVVLFLCWLLFKTRLGFLFRVIGDNETYLTSLGQNPKTITMCGLAVSNAIIGLGGGLLVHYKNTMDVNMTFGLLVGALASMLLGETTFSAQSLWVYQLSNIVGTVIYNFAIALVLFSWSPSWERYVMASDVRLIAGLLLIIPSFINGHRLTRLRLFRSEW